MSAYKIDFKYNTIWLAALLLLSGLTLLCLPVQSSLWLDETISVWITQSTLQEAWQRSLSYQGQSPLYFLILWLVTQAGANTELAVRLPSIVAAAVSLLAICLLVRKFTGQWQAGFAAALTLLVQDEFLKFAISVRPYSLAFAATLLATLYWVYYLSSARLRHLLLYLSSALAMIYLHVSFLPVLGLHLLGFLLLRSTTRVKLLKVVLVLFGLGLAAIPAILNLPKMEAHHETYRNIMFLPWYLFPSRIFFPTNFSIAFFFSLIAGILLIKGAKLQGIARLKPILTWSILWHFLPPLGFIFAQFAFNSPFVLPRYYLWFLPGLSILSGCLISTLQPNKARLVFLLLFFNFAFLLNAGRKLEIEDWKRALDMQVLIQPQQPVLFHSGLAELNTSAWINKPEHLDYLLTPARVYAPQLNIIPLPPEVDDSVKSEYFWNQIQAFAGQPFSIMVLQVKRPGNPTQFVHEYYQELLAENGYNLLGQVSYGLVKVYTYQKSSAVNTLPEQAAPGISATTNN